MRTLLDAATDGRNAEAVLAVHVDALRRFESAAERALEAGRIEEAIGVAEFAAWVATMNHPGVLASDRLEAVLVDISAAHLDQIPRVASAGTERVLMIATEVYDVGAHTRLMRRWVARDPDREYTVALTRQRAEAPSALGRELAAMGGRLEALDPALGPLERAAALRALGAEADVIAVLDHPHDPIPTVALAGMKDRPPVVMMNHGDHLFWLGRPIVDVLMCTRDAGVRFAARRGFPAARVLRTPFPISGPDGHGRDPSQPLGQPERDLYRAELRLRCGWADDATVLMTVGNEYKYEGVPGVGLLDEVRAMLQAHPHACMAAVGPDDTGRWRALGEELSGRVLALGALTAGVERLLGGADVYLESRPFGGPGACAEAAAAGLPVLSGAITEDELTSVFTDGAYATASTDGGAGYEATLRELIRDPGLRADMGERARLAAAELDAAWEAAVEETYAMARSVGSMSEVELEPLPTPGIPDILVDFSNQGKRRLELGELERLVETVEVAMAIQSPIPLLDRLEAAHLRQLSRYPIIFAAPRRTDAETLQLTVAALRRLRRIVVATRCIIALAPEDTEAAIPILQGAIAAGEDFDVELVADAVPSSRRPPGALQVIGRAEPAPMPPFYVCEAIAD